jgi:hypothetical protein
MPKSVFTVTTNFFGEPRLFGVYKEAEGALAAVQHLTEGGSPDDGDEFRIRKCEVESTKSVKETLNRCRAHRAVQDALPTDEELVNTD